MQAHEADEFVKLFEAMNRRFRALFNFPVSVRDGSYWIISRTPKEIFLACRRRKASSARIKGSRGLKKTTNLYEFRLFRGRIFFYSGKNKNVIDLGQKRAEIAVGMHYCNWIGGTKSLMRRLGEIDEVRANISDPRLMSG